MLPQAHVLMCVLVFFSSARVFCNGRRSAERRRGLGGKPRTRQARCNQDPGDGTNACCSVRGERALCAPCRAYVKLLPRLLVDYAFDIIGRAFLQLAAADDGDALDTGAARINKLLKTDDAYKPKQVRAMPRACLT